MARILILTPQAPIPPQALTGTAQGTTIRNFSLLAGLASRHQVLLATFIAEQGATESTASLLRPYCQSILTAVPPQRPLSLRARDSLITSLPDMALRLWLPSMYEAIAASTRQDRYDVIQVEGIEMAPYMLRLLQEWPRGTDKPRFVFDDHNAEYVLQQRAFTTDARRPARWLAAGYSLIQWQKLRRYERHVCQAADRVVAVSEADREALLRLGFSTPVAVIPNGVDLTFHRPGVVPAAPQLGPASLVFTGKMDYRPNVDAVLWFVDEVLPSIRTEMPDSHFYVVGQQPHKRLARLAGRSDVTVTGRVPDVRPYVAGAGVYVVPLRIGGGTRLKVLEAMAMGQAMVSTRLGCDGFPFEHGREVRFADDPAAFAAEVLQLLRNPSQAAQLGRAARSYVEAHFGWDVIVPRLEELYT